MIGNFGGDGGEFDEALFLQSLKRKKKKKAITVVVDRMRSHCCSANRCSILAGLNISLEIRNELFVWPEIC